MTRRAYVWSPLAPVHPAAYTALIAQQDVHRRLSARGLLRVESLQDVEINCMFDPRMGSRGYATEAARSFLAIGFRRHDLRRMDLGGAGSSIRTRFPGKPGK